MNRIKPQVHIIDSKLLGTGKSTLAMAALTAMEERGLHTVGVVLRRVYQVGDEDRLVGIDAILLPTRETVPLARVPEIWPEGHEFHVGQHKIEYREGYNTYRVNLDNVAYVVEWFADVIQGSDGDVAVFDEASALLGLYRPPGSRAEVLSEIVEAWLVRHPRRVNILVLGVTTAQDTTSKNVRRLLDRDDLAHVKEASKWQLAGHHSAGTAKLTVEKMMDRLNLGQESSLFP